MLSKKHFLAVLFLCCSVLASAYDAIGHRIIADIAYQHLTDKARAKCDSILGKRGIVYQATWADEVRSDDNYRYSYPYHYQNFKDNLTTDDLQKLLNNPTAEGQHLFYGMNLMRINLRNNTAAAAESLKFLVHFIGDLHQPLHLGRASDLGANKIKIKWFGRETNLHAVWDGRIIESKKMSYTEYSQYLQDKFSAKEAEYKQLSLLQSIAAVYAVRSAIYAYDYSDKNTFHYLYRFSDDIDEMLYRGGIQLANFLNEIFK